MFSEVIFSSGGSGIAPFSVIAMISRMEEIDQKERARLRSAKWRAAHPDRKRELDAASQKRVAERDKANWDALPAERKAKILAKREAKQAYDAKRYEEQQEESKQRAAKWYAENKDAYLPQLTAKRHKQAVAEGREPGRRARAWLTDAQRKRNKRESLQQWREQNPEKRRAQVDAYYEKTKEEFMARAHQRRARVRNAKGKHTAAELRALKARQQGKCAFCLKPFGSAAPHLDHYIALINGGTNDIRNLRLLHPKCNLQKGSRDPIEFGLSNGLLAW